MTVTPRSRLLIEGGVTTASGFVAGAITAGLRSRPAPDLAVVAGSDGPLAAAAVFTANRFAAAPVLVAREVLAEGGGRARAVAINAGCANAGTGEAGVLDARRMAAAVARSIGCDPAEVLPASTGLIGSRLRVDLIESAVEGIRLGADPADGLAAATAIMTTDTRPKQAAARLPREGGPTVTVGGMAKGAGMIHPQMATMLAVLTTDASAAPDLLNTLLRRAVEGTFNQVSVDGDTSTNDAVFLLASGAADAEPITPDTPAADDLAQALTAVCCSLAQQIAADGEGARTRIDVVVHGAASDEEARYVARMVAASNLVKAAVHGGDPNWGRIASAAGQSGARLDPARLAIRIGTEAVYDGRPLAFDEEGASRALLGDVVELGLDLRLGDGRGEAWGCDLSSAYVAINSEYRT